ncbi:putative 6-phosphofructo-2-kinase/fructose-2,6-bisphosphatase [Neolecta irregularis DAH-3]|uniref:Putative 6-phosphofructo-2-kinase/fructose-2,6-bisphosphatase n=1 Tax=Neolecta irregularis (strain DAH-3) TaxID=1198029 RepID=A0A1U7LIE1_NEOID|nr:putative 6-phosphofructo-2-kinase/fructose-2,6-bisphosphatase [Neolecta irregularis DAH-3]|eukprot:OLL22363.1 putative 6-phosphofructo-2-kinase/fructose-2,6-bisphosphatase [Neolecta irregularis DAH-3]
MLHQIAPAQLYETESGRLFHAGRIAICTVGLPARGKTHISVSLCRYLRWLGVKTAVFHLGDYRRVVLEGQELPPDFFFVNTSESTTKLRENIRDLCRNDMKKFYEQDNGQVAIYDAVNPSVKGRKNLVNFFQAHNAQVLFIESICDNEKIIEANVLSVKISSPDYVGWQPKDAVKDYLQRINNKIPYFETIKEPELNYVKIINVNERMIVNNHQAGYLWSRIVFYLMNLHTQYRKLYFARAGNSEEESSYKADTPLDLQGQEFSRRLMATLVAHRKKERQDALSQGDNSDERSLSIWTSPRIKSVQTADALKEQGYKVRQRPQLMPLNPGVLEMMTREQVREKYPEEVEKHKKDPYHHRFPRAESYHDVAVRLEPVILEMERSYDDLLIIAHESVLRVLYAYLMGVPADVITIPQISKFSTDQDNLVHPAT